MVRGVDKGFEGVRIGGVTLKLTINVWQEGDQFIAQAIWKSPAWIGVERRSLAIAV